MPLAPEAVAFSRILVHRLIGPAVHVRVKLLVTRKTGGRQLNRPGDSLFSNRCAALSAVIGADRLRTPDADTPNNKKRFFHGFSERGSGFGLSLTPKAEAKRVRAP